MEADSMELRQRVVAVYEEGVSTLQELADQFRVSRAWVKELLRRWRKDGSLAPLPGGRGFPPQLDATQRAVLAAYVKAHPDATQAEMRAHLTVPVSQPTISRTLAKLQLTFKKSPCGPANKTARMSPCTASGIRRKS